jgi:hypothetical protein
MRVGPGPERSRGRHWLRLYPRDWRERYGEEIGALLGERPVGWPARLDLLRGAFDAHLHPRQPPRMGLPTPLIAGVAWIAAGLATVVEPVPPDWPGYLAWTLPLGALGAVAVLRLVTVVGRRAGLRAPWVAGPVLLVAIAAHVAWIAALAVAIAGGPYGALTAAAQSIAAVTTVAIGLVRWRDGDHPLAEAVLVAGGAMLISSPGSWIVVGAAWLAAAAVAGRRRGLRAA